MTIWQPELPSERDLPLYLAIAQVLARDVRSGRLVPGDRLPTQRELADRLGVTVGTVSRAYAEGERAGLIRGEVGRGTFVRDPEERTAWPGARAGAQAIDLSVNLPPDAAAPDLGVALQTLAREPDVQSLLRYGAVEGRPADRRTGLEVLALHGLEATLEEVVVCAGAQHGLGVALRSVARPGDVIAAEELCYPGLVSCARSHGLRLRPVAMDAEGILPDALAEVCRSDRPKALYLTPTLQNPTAGTLSASRRERIAEIAARHALHLIEDDVHRMLVRGAPPPLAQLAPERTVYIASLSKVLAPGLRVGYLRIPAALRERVVDEVWSSLWSVSPLVCALAAQWVRDGSLIRIAAAKRDAAAERQTLARDVLEGLDLQAGPTAYHAWLRLDATGFSATEFGARALAAGVVVSGAEAFYLGAAEPPAAVRLSLSAEPDLERLRTGLARLRAIATGARPARPVRL